MDRRRSPVPPPREPRHGDGRPLALRDTRDLREGRERTRRPRSISPDRHPRRSPGPYKRYRRDDDYYDRYDRGASPPGYGRRSPPYRGRYDDRGYDERGYDDRPYGDRPYEDRMYRDGPRDGVPNPPPESERKEPKSFKAFLLGLDDSVTPEQAQQQYQQYLAEFYGSQIRAEFESRKNEESVRQKYDPRYFEKALAKRAEEAKESAQQLAADVESGKLDPSHADFNQGALELAPKPGETAPQGEAKASEGAAAEAAPKAPDTPAGSAPFAPAILWKASRVATDYITSRDLIRKLDQEKGVESNALVPPASQPGAGDEGKMEVEEEEVVEVNDSNHQEMIGKLDLQLTYLWRVHGLDYYGGHELDIADWSARLTTCRLLRGPCPEEGEEGDKATESKESDQLQKVVDDLWKERLEQGDPLVKMCARDRVEEELEKWVESQIIKKEENKWGNKLSNKMFIEKKFVVKHIKTKQEHHVVAEREKIYDQIYWENFKKGREAEESALRKQQEQDVAAGMEAPPPDYHGEYGFYEEGYHGGRGGRGMPPRRGGRGLRGMGGRRGPPAFGMEGPILAGPQLMPMAPMGQMFVPAAGAGPMGPFVLAPMPGAAAPVPLAPMDMDPGMIMMGGMPRGVRGRGMMRGRGRGAMAGGPIFMVGGPGAKLDPRGIREYYDLDAPHNNRAVLDYGDL